jgi:hypothetical protein
MDNGTATGIDIGIAADVTRSTNDCGSTFNKSG